MKLKLLVIGFCMLMAVEIVLAQAETLNVTSYAVAVSSTWTVPAGVTSVLVEVQGGGGGSGGCAANSNTGGGGGGGGGYAGQWLSVTPGETYTIIVGAVGSAGASGDNDGGTGGLTRLNNSLYQINATGGIGGLRGSTGTGGAGGTGASSFPGTPITYTGGIGGSKSSDFYSGGGGGGASRAGNGGSASDRTAGIGNNTYGGVGGAGRNSDGAGVRGTAFSSGAAGASCDSSSSVRAGATGHTGIIVLSYYVPSTENYPRIINISQGGDIADSVSHNVTMPSGIASGDLLLMIISSDGNRVINTTTDASWNNLHSRNSTATITQAAFYKIADGTETSNMIGTSASEMISYMVFAIRNAGTPVSASAGGSSTNADPPLLETGQNEKYLWIAAASWDSVAGFSITAMPSGFNSFTQTAARNINSVSTAASWRYFENSSLDPGTYTSTTEQWVASTIAIPYNATRYLVTNITANLSIVLANNTSTLLNETPQTGIVQALIKHSSKERKVAVLELNFTANLDLSSLRSDVNVENRKSYVHGYASINEILNLSLLIPRVSGSGSVFICPGAESIEQVNTSCAGLVNINTGETADGMSVSEVSYGGNDYYLVSNITGTGGGEADASNLLQCVFVQNTTCPPGTAKLIGVKNDSDGYNNAHAQNNTLNTYNYSLCCNSTNASITITTACPGDDTVIRLSNTTNSHVELGSLSAYPYLSCLASDWKRINCEYPTASCAANYACIMSIAGTEGNNQTNAHIGDCSSYDQKVCCALTNFAPAAPILRNPTDGNTTVFERKVNFNWSASIDPDGDSVSYILNASCGSCSAGCYEPLISSIATTNYTVPNALCVDVDYNWTVSACDTYGDCNTSSAFTFRITSVADLILTVNTTSFGTLALGENKDTTAGDPAPMVARNIGNVLLNVTINATNLFSTAGMDGYHFQFKADEQEPGSYAQSCSQHAAFAFMSNVTPKTLFCNLSYVDANDEGQIEYNLTVPISEPPGAKSSYIEVSYVKSE